MSINNFLTGLSKVVSDLVGNQLSTTKAQSGTKPSVFVARQKPPKPEYPYAACDYVGMGNIGRGLYQEFDTNTNTLTSSFNRTLRLRVAMYGNYSDDILSKIEYFRNSLFTDKGKYSLKTNMNGAGILSVSAPQLNSNVLSTDFEEFAFVVIDFWTIDSITESVTAIEGVEYEGAVEDLSIEQDDEPLIVHNVILNN